MKNFLVPYRAPFRSMKYPVRETWKWVCVDFYFLCHEYLQCNIACFYVLIHNFSTRFWTNSLCYEHEVSRISNKLFCKLFMNIPIFSRFLFTGFSYLTNHHLKHSKCMFWVLVNGSTNILFLKTSSFLVNSIRWNLRSLNSSFSRICNFNFTSLGAF